MSDTVTHTRGAESSLHPITGEPPGIKEILERRAAEGNPPTPETEQPKPETPKPEDDPATVAAREIAAARREAADANTRAAESERQRIAAESARQAAVQGAEDNGFTAIVTALAATEREKETLTAEMKTAGEAGDFARMADISARLGEIGGELRDLRQGRQAAETDRQTRLTQPTDRPRQQEQPTAATATERQILANLGVPNKERFLAQRTPQTRDFLYQYPQFFTDPAFHQRMVGADMMAVGRGLERDTPAYFDAVRKEALGETTPPPRRETQSSTPPGTPPSREAPGPSGRQVQSGDVYVSQDDKTTAEWMGVDPVDYVTEKNRLRNNGEWPYRRR